MVLLPTPSLFFAFLFLFILFLTPITFPAYVLFFREKKGSFKPERDALHGIGVATLLLLLFFIFLFYVSA